jgi:hypothetical protein
VPTEKIVLNLGGEGEIFGAVNLNLLATNLRSLPLILASGPVVLANFTWPWPIGSDIIDEVVGNRLPMLMQYRLHLCSEAFRVLRPGGSVRLFETSAGAEILLPHLNASGFSHVRVAGGFAEGVKPS